MGKGVVYIPLYAEDLEVMRESMITAEQIGRAVYALGEYLETGTRPEVAPDILFAFNLMAKKLDNVQKAYADKVAVGRESAQRQHAKNDAEEAQEETPEEAEKGTQGYPRVPKGTQGKPGNKNKNNKNINIKEKEKNKEKEKAPRIPSGTGPPNKFDYQMRNDDLNKVLMEL